MTESQPCDADKADSVKPGVIIVPHPDNLCDYCGGFGWTVEGDDDEAVDVCCPCCHGSGVES